jgi:hypothetical protein
MANLAANSIIGNNTGSAAVPIALTAAQVRTLINVANGATANTGTVTSVGGTGTVSGLTLTGTVTTSGNLTLGGTFSAPISSINDSTSSGQAIVKITNPVSAGDYFLRLSRDGSSVFTSEALTASTFRSAIGAGVGSVTSVGGTGTVSGLTLTGTVTSSGNLTLGGTLSVAASNFGSQTANTFLAAPNGSAGTPTFRAIVAADVPTLNQNTTGTAANVTGTVAIANGGTGATTAANARIGLGATTVGANLFTLTNPSAITFIRLNANNTASTLNAADFRTAIGAGTSSTTGTVTSVGGTGTVSGLTLTGTVTTTGNLTLGGTLSVTGTNFGSQTSNQVLIAPNGTNGNPTFRLLASNDIPTISIIDKTSGTLTVARGGTGATTLASGEVLIGAGTGAVTTLSRNGIDSRASYPPEPHTLGSHSDVIISSPSNGQVLKYDGSGWINAADAIGANGDVSGPGSSSNEDIVVFDGTTGKIIKSAGLTLTDITTLISGKADTVHTHAASAITSGTLDVARGGTGTGTHTSGNVLIGAGTGAVTTLSRSGIDSRTTFPPSTHTHSAADITSGTLAVAQGGTGQTTLALARNAMGLGNTTGALPVANGGTNATSVSQGGIIYGASTSAYASTAAGTSGQLLRSNGTSAPTWTDSFVNISSFTSPTASNGATGVTLSVNETIAIGNKYAIEVSDDATSTNNRRLLFWTQQTSSSTSAAAGQTFTFIARSISTTTTITYKFVIYRTGATSFGIINAYTHTLGTGSSHAIATTTAIRVWRIFRVV